MTIQLERPQPRRRPRRRSWLVVGTVLLAVGLTVLGAIGWTTWRDDETMARAQESAGAELQHRWSVPDDGAALRYGDPVARITIPRFGADWSYTILEGTGQDVLAEGPGHYPGSAGPGALGNFAVAGHRVGHHGVFDDAAELQPCDAIVVETRTQVLTYRMLPTPGEAAGSCATPPTSVPGREIVTPDADRVLWPVPDTTPTTKPYLALITLTTCHPRFSARQRMIIHGVLTDVREKGVSA
jgi:sortase A